MADYAHVDDFEGLIKKWWKKMDKLQPTTSRVNRYVTDCASPEYFSRISNIEDHSHKTTAKKPMVFAWRIPLQ
jgi:hypothetical protein